MSIISSRVLLYGVYLSEICTTFIKYGQKDDGCYRKQVQMKIWVLLQKLTNGYLFRGIYFECVGVVFTL